MKVATIIVGLLLALFGGGCAVALGDMAGPTGILISLIPFIGGIMLVGYAWTREKDQPIGMGIQAVVWLVGLLLVVVVLLLVPTIIEFW